jgi:hypothetical protein
MYNATNDVDKALNDLPLKKTGEIYHASSMRMSLPIRYVPIDFVAGLKGEVDLSTNNYAPDKKQYKGFDDKRGEYKAQLDTYTGQFSDEVIFYTVGDADKIKELLTFIDGIGRKTNQGVGGFSSFTIEEMDDDWSLYHDSMKVMRPIPKIVLKDMFPKINCKSLVWDKVAFKGPYWEASNQADCYVPDSDRLPMGVVQEEFDDEF